MRRYRQYGQVIEVPGYGKVTLGLAFLDLLYTGRVIYHTIEMSEEGRLDLIAWKYLNDPHLWEIIAWFNGVNDPLSEIYPGASLAIPLDTVNKVTQIIGNTYRGAA